MLGIGESNMQEINDARFPIGTKFKTRGKHPREMTVIDILRTYNSEGDLVKVRYVTTHEFCGQLVHDHDICDATIALGGGLEGYVPNPQK
jgi:hypothetical protein